MDRVYLLGTLACVAALIVVLAISVALPWLGAWLAEDPCDDRPDWMEEL